MRKILFVLPVIAFLACGDDTTTEPGPPDEITISVNPSRVILDVGDQQNFSAFVYGSSNINVSWLVQDIPEGNSELGTIDQDGGYAAPNTEPNADSIKITAVAEADTTVRADAWVILIDPSKIYVSETGSDSTGTGSKNMPYRTITHGLFQAVSTQTVIVESGVYSSNTSESFPLEVPAGVILLGKGGDSTFVIGPGGSHDEFGAVIKLVNFPATVEGFNISTADNDGVGVWMLPGSLIKVRDNHIRQNYIGIAAVGANLPRPIIESNLISGDSIGVMTSDSSEPIMRDNQIVDCGIIGIHILDSSRPDLGTVDSTDAGGNTIRDCGPGNQWLIRNETPNTIWAVGNNWVRINPEDNDEFIYDDDENANSGQVFLINQ